jgi:hypothetical protein
MTARSEIAPTQASGGVASMQRSGCRFRAPHLRRVAGVFTERKKKKTTTFPVLFRTHPHKPPSGTCKWLKQDVISGHGENNGDIH